MRCNVNKSILVLLSLLAISMSTPRLFAQQPFQVVSTNPAAGDTTFTPNATLSMEFSAAVDSSVQFPYPGFFINLMLHPDTLMGEPDAIRMSADLKTVYVDNLYLTEDRRYLLMIFDVQNTAGDSLDIPYVATFSTGSKLPTATTAGTIMTTGESPVGTVVALMNRSLFDENDSDIEAAAVVDDEGGAFLIKYIPAGVYWPVALKNFAIDEYGDISPNSNSSFGFYDPDGDMQQDSIIIYEGDTIESIDMLLGNLEPVTARANYPVISDSAASWAPDAGLLQITGGELTAEGEAIYWEYLYYSQTEQMAKSWAAVGPMVVEMEADESYIDTTALPDNWIDSDAAAAVAEANGGAEFRAMYETVDISAMLGYTIGFGDDDGDEKALTKRIQWKTPEQQNKFTISKQQLQQLATDMPYWFFMYYAGDEFMEWGEERLFIVNAITGEFVDRTTAAEAEASAFVKASEIFTDPELVMVVAPGFWMGGISEDGLSSLWMFTYYSPTENAAVQIMTLNGIIVYWEEIDIIDIPLTQLPQNWIDSDSALALAEQNGGANYRAQNENVMVTAMLGVDVYFVAPGEPIWVIEYYSMTADVFVVVINAMTGEVKRQEPLTAREALAAITDSVGNWGQNPQLVSVENAFDEPLDDSGRAVHWGFAFYFPLLQTNLYVATQFDQIVALWPYNEGRPYINTELPENWLDSDSAIVIADEMGGEQFQQSHEYWDVFVELAHGNYLPAPETPTWHFSYYSDSDSLNIYFDCVTGQIPSRVETVSTNTISGEFVVEQNYPNPFNPETIISYDLPKSTDVRISIYNILGRQVKLLVDERKQAGSHSLKWDGKDGDGVAMPSGIYFYQIEAGSFNKIMKMTLVR